MKDRIFNVVLYAVSVLVLLLCGGLIFSLAINSRDIVSAEGVWGFITSTDWNPTEGRESYGALPFIVGTVVTSLLALALCIPLALAVALLAGYYLRGQRAATYITTTVDLLAGVPSIVYGLWGFYALRPWIASLGLNPQGLGIATASLVLAVMIVPYAASLCREFLLLTPSDLSEGAYSLGATQRETVMKVIMPTARKGFIAAFVLALGRALGETMAVTMLIGNTNQMISGLGDTGNTMASLIANQFGEASGIKLSALFGIAFVLFLVTAAINLIAKAITRYLK